MKKLGTVKNVIHDGTILLCASGGDLPATGARVFDRRGAEVGRVARVFGPAGSPYVSLRPKPDADTLELLGTTLYLDPEERPAERRMRKGGSSFAERKRHRPGPVRKKGVKEFRRKEKPRKR